MLAAWCANTGAAEKRAYLAPGTQRMAERLRKHIEDAGLKNPNASLPRSESARAQLLLSNSLARTFGLRLDLAVNLLNGGKSEAALKEFQNVRQFLAANGKLTARNASDAFELRCWIREQLIGYLREHHPEALPRLALDRTDDLPAAP